MTHHEKSSRLVSRVTVILPLHNEAENIKGVVDEVVTQLATAGYFAKIVLVDDGSVDGSLEVIREICSAQASVKYISFSRNFGKEIAILAGLNECGDDFDALACMDSDGQHAGEDLLNLLAAAESPTVDIACGVRSDRNYQTGSQRMMANAFYWLFRYLSDTRIETGVGDFIVMKPHVVKTLRQVREQNPFVKGLVGWIGFEKQLVPIKIRPRLSGDAKQSTSKMIRLAFRAILSFSSLPLRAWSVLGITSALLAALYLVFVVIQTAVYGKEVPGYATIVVLLLGLGGLQLLSIGMVGEYVARIHDASKMRPLYIIKSKNL